MGKCQRKGVINFRWENAADIAKSKCREGVLHGRDTITAGQFVSLCPRLGGRLSRWADACYPAGTRNAFH